MSEAALLVRGKLRQTARMSLFRAKRSCDEDLHETKRKGLLDAPRPQRHHIGIVVKPGEKGRFLAVDQRAPNTPYLVGGHRLTVARATNHNATTRRIGSDRFRGRETKAWIVIVGIEGERAMIHGLAPELLQTQRDLRLEVEPGMVATEMNAHSALSFACSRRRHAGWKQCRREFDPRLWRS